MKNTSAWPTDDIETIIHTYGDMLFRLCLITLGNQSDAEDALQETFIKYIKKYPEFKNAEHEKAWLIKVATNKCRDIIRYKNNHPIVDIEEIKQLAEEKTNSGIFDALMTLPSKSRTILTLYYVEGYSVKEIAKIIGKTTSCVKMRLQKGRRLLKDKYREEYM